MRLASTLALLLCFTSSTYAGDKPETAKPLAEPAMCKSVCVSARQDCRAKVQGATENDTDNLLLSMKPDNNPYANAAKEVRPQSQQLRPTEAEAFRARRAERLQACEAPYRSCTRACA